MRTTLPLLSCAAALFTTAARAHAVAWAPGMFCKNGLSNADNPNADYPMRPLVDQSYSGWFMHGPCRNYPPPEGEFLQMPAGGSFTVDISPNRAWTDMSYNGTKFTNWGDGLHHPNNYSAKNPAGYPPNELGCLATPNLHTPDQAGAAGTVFAISYEQDLAKVNMDNLVVFTVAYHTPFFVRTTYHVPADMPACPEGGCICAWGWVPNHCGQANVYMNGYRCKITGAKADAPKLAAPKSPVWCENDPSKCVKGAKKMIIYYQNQANTVDLSDVVGTQADGQWPSPGYNKKMGFDDGAQEDIFEGSVAAESAPAANATTKAAPKTTSKAAPKTTAKPAPKTTAKPAPKVTTKPAPKASNTKPAAHTTAHTTHKAAPKPTETKHEPMPKAKPKPKPKAKSKSKAKPKPKPKCAGHATDGKSCSKTSKAHRHHERRRLLADLH